MTMHRLARKANPRERKWESMYTPGSATHLMVIYPDDPPPFEFSQDSFAKFAPVGGDAEIKRQRMYPKTKFINWLASKGMIYTRATNTCVCSSGRASLHAGVYPNVHGLGTIVRPDRGGGVGDLCEFHDPGFTTGQTVLATVLGNNANCVKGWIGKTHLSLSGYDTNSVTSSAGLEWTMYDTSGESASGRLGDWDRRVLLLNNPNQAPIPGGTIGVTRYDYDNPAITRAAALAAGNDAGSTDQTSNGGAGSYYCYRYRDEGTERNVGTVQSSGSGTAAEGNSNGVFGETLLTDEAILFWEGITGAEVGFLLHTPNLTHSPYDLPPIHTQSVLDENDYQLHYSNPAAIPVWKRQQAQAEALDYEMARMWESIPAAIRNNLVIIFAADNGIDPPYLQSMVESGKDVGAHLVMASENNRTKSSLWRYGIGSQMFAFGPTVAQGTCDALIEVAVDLHATIAEFFGVTVHLGAAHDGLEFTDTWAGTEDHTRARGTTNGNVSASTFHSYWFPHGSMAAATQPELAPVAEWNPASTYVQNNVVFWAANDGLHQNWIAVDAGGAAAGQEPGVVSEAIWAEYSLRDAAITAYVTTGYGGEDTGFWKLHRRLGDTALVTTLYRTHDVNGVPVDEYEENDLAGTATATASALLTLLQTEMPE